MHFHNTILPEGKDNERWTTFRLNILALSDILKKGDRAFWCVEHADRENGDFKPYKYERCRKLYDEKMQFEMPTLMHNGRVPRLTDGRHRLYVLIDKDYTSVDACCEVEHLEPLQRSVGY